MIRTLSFEPSQQSGGSFFLRATFFFLPTHQQAKPPKKQKILSRVCVRARIDENNNSLELYILFYRNTLVFLFIKNYAKIC